MDNFAVSILFKAIKVSKVIRNIKDVAVNALFRAIRVFREIENIKNIIAGIVLKATGLFEKIKNTQIIKANILFGVIEELKCLLRVIKEPKNSPINRFI